jgi:hypothetical protein
MDEIAAEVAEGGVEAVLTGDIAGLATTAFKVGGVAVSALNAKLDYTCWPGFAPVLYGQAVELLPPVFVALARRLDDPTASMGSASMDRKLFVGLTLQPDSALDEEERKLQEKLFPKDTHVELHKATKKLAECKKPKLVAELLARWVREREDVQIPAKGKETAHTIGKSVQEGNLDPEEVEKLLGSLNRKQVRPQPAASRSIVCSPAQTDR